MKSSMRVMDLNMTAWILNLLIFLFANDLVVLEY